MKIAFSNHLNSYMFMKCALKRIAWSALMLILCFDHQSFAQGGKVYTVLEAGGMLGLNSQNNLDGQRLNGYKIHLIVGKNFDDHAFVGFGLGNEVYQASKSTGPFKSRFSLLPFLADVRVPLRAHFLSGRLGVVGNAGYAPRVGNDLFKGALFHGGMNLIYPIGYNGPDVAFTLGYSYQQIVLPYEIKNLQQQSISLTIGLFIN